MMKYLRKARMDETFFLSEDQMSMHGVLYKKGRNLVKKYKKRWFVLPDNSFRLDYYTGPQGKLLGSIEINNILSVKPLPSAKKHLFGMQLTTGSRVYSLYARTAEERDGWCSCFMRRHRELATQKLSIRDGISLDDDPERNCATVPKLSSSPNTPRHMRESPRRALSDGMLRSNRLAHSTPAATYPMDATSIPPPFELRVSSGLQANPSSNFPDDLRNSLQSPRARSPISISDETARNKFQDTVTVIHNSAYDDDTMGSIVNSPEGSTSLDDGFHAQLVAKVNKLEHDVAEKDATIAALHAMLKRQSLIPVRRENASVSPAPGGKNRAVQQNLDEYVGMSMWLEQHRTSELQQHVQRLKEANDDLGALLEEERQKCLYLEREKYNMQCMIEHLEREKVKT